MFIYWWYLRSQKLSQNLSVGNTGHGLIAVKVCCHIRQTWGANRKYQNRKVCYYQRLHKAAWAQPGALCNNYQKDVPKARPAAMFGNRNGEICTPGTQLTGTTVDFFNATINPELSKWLRGRRCRRLCMPNNTKKYIARIANAQTVRQEQHIRDTSAGGYRRQDRITHSDDKEAMTNPRRWNSTQYSCAEAKHRMNSAEGIWTAATTQHWFCAHVHI